LTLTISSFHKIEKNNSLAKEKPYCIYTSL